MIAALCNLGFTICGSHVEQVWPPLLCCITFAMNFGIQCTELL